MKLLEKLGYKCTRAAASLGEWDIIGISAFDVILVQVKTNKWPTAAEMERLISFKCPKNVIKEIHRWDDYARKPKKRRL